MTWHSYAMLTACPGVSYNLTYPKVLAILKPFLTTPVTTGVFTLETTLCEHLVETFAA